MAEKDLTKVACQEQKVFVEKNECDEKTQQELDRWKMAGTVGEMYARMKVELAQLRKRALEVAVASLVTATEACKAVAGGKEAGGVWKAGLAKNASLGAATAAAKPLFKQQLGAKLQSTFKALNKDCL